MFLENGKIYLKNNRCITIRYESKINNKCDVKKTVMHIQMLTFL